LAVVGGDALADQLVEVTAYTLNVRAAPSANAPIVGLVNKHDRLVVRPVSDNWAAVLHGTEVNGFVSRKYVRTIERQNTVTDRPKPTGISLDLALFAIFMISIAIALLLFRSRNRASGDSGSEYAARETKVADTRLPKPHQETPQVRKAIQSRNRTSGDIGSEYAARETKVTDTRLPKPYQETPQVRNVIQEGYQEDVLSEREEKSRIEDLPMANVKYVIDGDTVIVSSTWRNTTIRLDSIDCPEDGQPWGNVATAGLIKMIGGRRIRLEKHGNDHYGRLLATIYVQDKRGSEWLNVNEKMVVKGHAWVMRKYFNHLSEARKETLIRLERWARMKKVGLWSTSNPIPPWKWRK
jgi:endonuclease YncB( thermonuclease family)